MLFPFIFALFIFCDDRSTKPDFTQYINPMIGTGGHGHTYPGASMPFGMVQLSPDTRLEGWDGCSGYHYSDDIIYRLSHAHLSGTGISDYGDVLFMPSQGIFYFDNGYKGDYVQSYASKFSRKNETAEAGYYRDLLEKQNILVELTTTERAGFHKYTFSNSGATQIFWKIEKSGEHLHKISLWTQMDMKRVS